MDPNNGKRGLPPVLLGLMTLASAVILPTAAFADLMDDKYCSEGNTEGLAVTDMSYGVDGPAGATSAATDCYGVIRNGDLGSNGGNTTEDIINQIWGHSSGANITWGSGAFVELVKQDAGNSGPGVAGVLGYTWSLDGSTAAKDGTWILTANPLAGLPSYFDFVGVLKGSNGSAAYLFDEALFDGNSGGSWYMKFGNDNNDSIANLSNMTIYGRVGSSQPPQGEGVPVPAPLALLGLGGLVLGWQARRARS